MSTRKKVKGPWESAANDLVDTAQSIGKAAISKAEAAAVSPSMLACKVLRTSNCPLR